MLSVCLLREKYPNPVSAGKVALGKPFIDAEARGAWKDCYCVLGSIALALHECNVLIKTSYEFSLFPNGYMGSMLLERINQKLADHDAGLAQYGKLSFQLAMKMAKLNDADNFEEAYRLLQLVFDFDPDNPATVEEIRHALDLPT